MKIYLFNLAQMFGKIPTFNFITTVYAFVAFILSHSEVLNTKTFEALVSDKLIY